MELDAADLQRIGDIQRAMLAIPRDRSIASIRTVLETICVLVGAKGGWCGTWFDGELVFVPFEVGPQIEQQIRDNVIGIDEEGYFLMRDPEYESVNRRRRAFGSGVAPDWIIHEH